MLKIQEKLTSSFYAMLSMPATAMGFALSIQISALSWILSTKYHMEIDQIGIVWAAGPLAGIIAQPIVGAISDKVWFWGGRRRPFILIGGVLAALMLLSLPNIDIIGHFLGESGAMLGIAVIVALTLDLSINVSFNPTRSIIADVTPEGDDRTKGYTWMQTVSGSFGVLAYAIGASLGNYFLIYFGVILVLGFTLIPPFFIDEPVILEQEEEKSTFNESNSIKKPSFSFEDIYMGLLPLVGFLLYGVYVIVARLSGLDAENEIIEYLCLALVVILGGFVLIRSIKKEIDDYEFQKVLLAHAFTWLGIQTMFIYMFAYAKSNVLGFDPKAHLTALQNDDIGRIIAISFLILNLVGALFPTLVLEPVAKRIGRVRTHVLSIASMAISYLAILLFAHNRIILYLLMAFAGIGWASTISLPFAIMSERVKQSKMGLYMGIFNLSIVLPQLVASFKMGEIINRAPDKSIIFIICTITLSISAILWLFIREKHKKEALLPNLIMGE
ncbi:MAG TPA: MFS transporter [Balneolales bacterium]|nr:MFS transporter [Balneolales bacterium]